MHIHWPWGKHAQTAAPEGAAMPNLVMYDSIHLDAFAGITAMDAAAGYVDGKWPTYSQAPPNLASSVPAGTRLLSITVFGNEAECVDQEPGNIEPGPAAAWVAA